MLTGQRALNFCGKLPHQVLAVKNAKVIDVKEDVILVANSLSVVEVNRIVNPLIRRT
jgi:hypothetical protein